MGCLAASGDLGHHTSASSGSLGRFRGDSERLAERHRASVEPTSQRLAPKQFQHEIGLVLRPPDIVEGDDVGMGKPGCRLCFSEQPLLPKVCPGSRANGLEGNGPAKVRIVRFPHHPEAAPADLPNKLETADDRPRLERLVPR